MNEQVKRYDPEGYSQPASVSGTGTHMVESRDGDYVLASDYDALRAQVEKLFEHTEKAQLHGLEMGSKALEAAGRETKLRAEVERMRQALERIHTRAEAYTEAGRGMTECSTLVVAEIAHAALEGFR